MKKRVFLIVFVAVLTLAIAGGYWLWLQFTGPMYVSGAVRRGENLSAPLAPPAQTTSDGPWLVEPGIELAHFAVGAGRPVLIVHGGPGVPFSQPMSGLEPLTDRYRFHYYDQRGSGGSTRPFDRFSGPDTYAHMVRLERTLGVGAQLADIERIRQLLGQEQLILIGHSWGGLLASLYAAEFPDRVEALILIAPADMLVMPRSDDHPDLFGSVRERLPIERRADYDAFMVTYFDFGGLFTRSEGDLVGLQEAFAGYYGQAIGQSSSPQGRPGGWMVWAQYLSLGQRHDYRSALAAVDAPVLVLHGDQDLQSAAASQTYSQAFPSATFVVIEGAGHFSYEDQPERFAEAVANFLGRRP